MPLYRTKYVPFEAIQFRDEVETICALSAMLGTEIRIDYTEPATPLLRIENDDFGAAIPVGNWLVREETGRLIVYRPEIFEGLYEPVDEGASV